VLLLQVEGDEHGAETQSPKASDDALRLTTRILSGAVREMDSIGRYDRDCFSFLLPRTTLAEGLVVAQRVSQNIEAGDPGANRNCLQFTLSFGVAEVAEGDDVVRLLQRAEAAMLVAEKDRICYHNGRWPEVLEIAAQPPVLDLSAAAGGTVAGDAASAVS
jgi:PleD family two-component response regulator